jgi:hypothetical protein
MTLASRFPGKTRHDHAATPRREAFELDNRQSPIGDVLIPSLRFIGLSRRSYFPPDG